MLTVGIDASNISSGGGLTHLVQFLAHLDLKHINIRGIHIWCSSRTAQRLPQRSWLYVHSPRWCNARFGLRFCGQQLLLQKNAKLQDCDIIFSPGGILPLVKKISFVTMSQNMLPFESDRANLFGRFSLMRLKMLILQFIQTLSFRQADGLVFLSKYAQDYILSRVRIKTTKTALIPHGVETRFRSKFQNFQKSCANSCRPVRLLYVSPQLPYKHHIEVMQAVAQLRQDGCNVELTMVGQSSTSYGKAVKAKRLQLDPDICYLIDRGHVEFCEIDELYRTADIFVFASSCENLPNILIEAMAAGLPISCSNRGPMREILGDAGSYFDPENSESISASIKALVLNVSERKLLGEAARRRSEKYSWNECARETIEFILQVANGD